MPRTEWVHDGNAALFTDLYQLTMLQAYFLEEMREEAVFDLFVRRMRTRNFLIACGLDTILHYLETLHFTPEAISYLDGLGPFRTDFLDYLAEFRFTGDVFAVAEGTPVFPDEPILEVVAPIGEAQIVETFLLNQITFQTNIATKADRVVRAARGRLVADFGMRRMHGADAALKAVRAYYVAGIPVTSNVLGAFTYDIPPSGTMAHSYIEAHKVEADAFRAFAEIYGATTLIVDTYDTLEGVRKVVTLAGEMGEEFRVSALRLDSGDLVTLARGARDILDEAGLQQVRLFASGSLDEFEIERLLAAGAPIDGFGVGTRMGTSVDQPYLDSAYKLSAYAGEPRMKLSAEKSSIPGRKQIYRVDDEGRAAYDVIAAEEESIEGTPLLESVMRGGRRTPEGRRSLEDARNHARTSIDALPERLMDLEVVDPPYEVRLSPGITARSEATRRALTGR